MFEKIKNILNLIKEKIFNILLKIKNSFKKATNGDEGFNKLLWVWGVFPVLLVVFYIQDFLKAIRYKFISIPLWLLVVAFFIWHISTIIKTIKKHPEYKRKKEKKIDYSKMNKAKAKKLKQEEMKKKNVERLQKLMLMKSWKTMEFYKIVILMDCFVILVGLQNILG